MTAFCKDFEKYGEKIDRKRWLLGKKFVVKEIYFEAIWAKKKKKSMGYTGGGVKYLCWLIYFLR